MKKLLVLMIVFAGYCKAPTNFWNPVGEFPLLEKNGVLSKDVKNNFSLQTVDNQYDTLLINFFAPDCKPCIIEVPDLKKIYQNIQLKKNIKFIGIGSRLSSLSDEEVVDVNLIAPEIYKFSQAYKLDYPTYVARTKDLKNYGLTGFPETFILYRNVNGQWYVKRKFVGMITEKDVNPFLK
ncbi:MAG: TlpA family protein disulfide reductase [Spirochaetia bacterium]|nr:TlpA family protein disulfide reductase [Spirochaetia bacterium]